MFAPASTLDPAADAPAAWERALLDTQLEMLGRLAEMGMAIAGAVSQRASEPDADLDHIAMDFARVSRAVRMSLALQSKLVKDFKTPPKAASAETAADDAERVIDYEVYWGNGEPLTPAAKRRVLRQSVRGVAKDCGLDAETVERLETEAVERLEREGLYPLYPAPGNRPFHEVVGLICEDLGLAPGAEGSPLSAAERSDAAPPPEDLEPPGPPSPPRVAEPAWFSG
jgi:hypothetical protein